MNNDLINREDLRKAFHNRIYHFDKSSWDEANALIDTAPTVAKEVVRPQSSWAFSRCLLCGAYHNGKYRNFCPNCGADMREDSE